MAIFARVGTIKGESRDARHHDETEALSWTWGVSQTGTVHHGSGGGAGRPTFHDLTFTHHVDRASPLLMKACATGSRLPDARITVRRAGAGHHEHLVVTLGDVLVTSVSTSVTDEGDSALEAVVLAFATVDLEYTPEKPDGSPDTGVHFTYDLRTSTAG